MPPYLNLRLKDADILRLKPGDVVHINIARPIASSERRALMDAWQSVMARTGPEDDVTLFITAGEDVSLKVMRPELVEVG